MTIYSQVKHIHLKISGKENMKKLAKIIFILSFFCCLIIRSAFAISVQFGEDTTIRNMDWHESWKTLFPNEQAPDKIEFTSNGNNVHTYVSSSSPFYENNLCDLTAGSADAKIGIQLQVKGNEGQAGIAEITI